MTAPINPQKGMTVTDLAIPEQNHSPAVVAPAASPFTVRKQSLAEWARDADVAFQLATQLAKTSFVPSTMRGNVDNITACLLAGNELGLPPMAALKSMDVIHGTPGLRAHAMRGLVQSRGHEVEVVTSTDTACQMRGRRMGTDEWQTSTWTIARAQVAGYVAKNAMYKTNPTDMLAARATGEVCRWIASDVLHGVPYNTEELRDIEPQVTAVRVGAPATAAEILGRRSAPNPEQPALAAAAGEDQGVEEAVGEFVDTPTEDAPAPSRWQVKWTEVASLAQGLGWSKEQTEAEFTKENDGLTFEQASVEDLDAFAEHLINLAGGAA